MSKHASSNGSGGIDVHQEDMGGWLRVYADAVHPAPESLHVWLSHALTEWFRLRPQLLLGPVVAIAKGGETAELHAWYRLHTFPDASGQVATPRPG
ncbi:MAG: hypothetical protein K2W96_23855 [Gemmataceae bacterium]|nr:hypothetical protein [Gemmataceae bacterium]